MKKLFLVILMALFLIGMAGPAMASDVTLQWSPNSEPDLVGYRVFVRDWNGDYNYAAPAWEGATVTCTISDLNTAKLPHFVVRAYDLEGYESGDSNEVYLSNGPPASPGGLVIIPQGN